MQDVHRQLLLWTSDLIISDIVAAILKMPELFTLVVSLKGQCLSHLSSPLMPSTVLSRTAKVSSSTCIVVVLLTI